MRRKETEITAKMTRGGAHSGGLRKQAEEKAVQLPEKIELLSPEETRQMLHELRIHQIELEMQNEELRRAQEELEVSRLRYFDLYDLAPIGYVTVSEKGLILEANLTAANLLGTVRGALVKRPFSGFILPEDKDIYYLHGKKLFEAHGTNAGQACEPQAYELRMIKMDGSAFWARLKTAAAQETDGPLVCRVVLSDITDRKRVEAALQESEKRYRELSIIDGLTQLYNSRYFYHQLKMEIDRVNRYEEQPMTLLLLDLDDFKQFNDAYGHVEGDQVLSRLGQVVKRCLRQTDSAYRYGGEEFTIILPMTTSQDAVITAERIRTEFKKEKFYPAPGKDVHVTVSIGLGQYKRQKDMKAFVHQVDQLMYQAKKNGKDRVCCES